MTFVHASSPDVLLAAAALGVAALHVLVARRVDLGGAVVALSAMAWLAVPAVGEATWSLLAVASVLLALAWWRGASRGVGRVELAGLALSAGVLAAAASALLPTVVPGVDLARVRLASLAPLGLVGGLTVLLAFERRGPRGLRHYHYREVPVTGRVGAPAEPVDASARPPG